LVEVVFAGARSTVESHPGWEIVVE